MAETVPIFVLRIVRHADTQMESVLVCQVGWVSLVP